MPSPERPVGPLRPRESERPFLRRTFAALHHRDFRIFFLGQLVSVTGTWMQQVAQGWLVLVLTGSPFLLGVAAAARSLPVLILAFPAGVIADRYDRRWIIFGANAVSMVGAIILAVLTLADRIDIATVIALAFVLGCANAVELPARQSYVVELAGARHLANGIALNSLMFNAARVVGPSIAGIVVATLGVGIAFAINAVSFIPILASLLLIHPARAERAVFRARGALGETIAYLRTETRVAGLLGLLAANTIFASGYLYLGPTLTRDLGEGAAGFGLLLSATGLGAMAAGLWLAATAGRGRRAPVLVLAAVALSASLVGVSLSDSFLVTLVLFAGAGAGMISFNATSNTLIQTIVPDILRGRIMSLYVIVMLGILPVGSLLLGAVADRFSTATALGVGGIAWLTTVALAFALAPRLRSL